MNVYTEYAISAPEGKLIKRTVTEEELNLTNQIVDALSKDKAVTVTNAFQLAGWGNVNIHHCKSHTMLGMAVTHIPMRAPFKLIEGELVPIFGANLTDTPVLSLDWEPNGLPIKMGTVIQAAPNGATWQFHNQWFFAFDNERRCYRLPLPNIYEDCHICTGQFTGVGATLQELAERTMTQFATSNWSKDLLGKLEDTQRLFRWKPNGEGFQVLMPELDWTELCQKVSVQPSEYVP